MSDPKYSLWLSLIALPGSRAVCRLIEAFDGDSEAIYRADKKTYEKIPGIRADFAEQLTDKRMDRALRTLDYCDRNGIDLLPFDSERYPKRLRRLPDFPVLLYCRGRLPDIDNEVAIAAVGTRRITEYGQNNAYLISRDLARAGAIVVSGMASGVDTCCHRGALDALGHTIAVLGCGIDVVYPKSNADLMEEIARFGTVITEYRPGTEPAGYNFPKRNRIISGLSLGTVVVEADEKSGAMITARLALEQGRDIYALPGNVGEMNSLGTNALIKSGARMVTSALDILENYELIFPQKIHPERILPSGTSMRVENTSTLKVASSVVPIRNDLPKDHNGFVFKAEPPAKAAAKNKPAKGSSSRAEKKPKKADKSPKNTPAPSKALPADLTDIERRILDAMPDGRGITTDEIARQGIPVTAVLVSLTTLEIKQLVVSLPGGTYMKNT